MGTPALEPEAHRQCGVLARELDRIMKGVDVGMGTSGLSDRFQPFYLAREASEPPIIEITKEFVRSRFAGSIFPPATITIDKMSEEGSWWADVLYDSGVSELEDELDDLPAILHIPVTLLFRVRQYVYLRPWRKMIRWFSRQSQFVDCAFISIGDPVQLSKLPPASFPPGTELYGSVLPRLAVGLTAHGFLVGLFGIVHKK